ncbi:MAG: hemolysin family protein [Candidatus Omnitrophica bacterium]|nr:hemolysin family protein [Candidatus Omnitrophota bacterium]MDD5237370.1 hemolysin family protein [Candidatus Omnitrophota bacterium]
MDHMLSFPIIAIILLVLTLLSFLFSASETSIISLSKIRLRHMVARGVKRAQIIQRLIVKLDKFIVAILVGNNFVNIAISAIVSAMCVFIFGYKWGVIIATLVTALFILILCEITPKILAIKHTERIALLIAPIMDVFIKVFKPVIFIFTAASNLIIKLLRIEPSKRSPLITEEELRLMIELGEEEGFLSDQEGRMLQRIFVFGDTKAGDAMVPKEKIVAVNINATTDELLNIFVERGHARLPVYQESLDNIVGIIYAHDLLYVLRDKGLFLLQDLIHEAYYVSSLTPVSEIMKKFQSDKIQIAVVVDQHKKTVGLVTLEDLIEEIVGELEEKDTKRHVLE